MGKNKGKGKKGLGTSSWSYGSTKGPKVKGAGSK